jgi:hypothetical protein
VVAPLAEVLSARFPKVTEVTKLGTLLQFAPGIQTAEITRAIVKAVGLSAEQAAAIVTLWSFDGTHRSDLWQRPLVPIDEDTVVVVTAALYQPNLYWVIDYWLRVGGMDMALRGPAFETEVRSTLRESNKLPTCHVYPTSLTLRGDSGYEELDVVIQIGHTVVLAEVKCSLSPAEPYDFTKWTELLSEASTQVKRKAAYARANISHLAKALGTTLPPSDLRVVPAIVTNLPMMTGHALDVPVTDIHVLRRYIAEGYLDHFPMRVPGSGIQGGQRNWFYTSPEEAANNVGAYLVTPPQLELILTTIRFEARGMIQFAMERPLVFRCAVVRPEAIPGAIVPDT